eukprot:COSAG05_NODE_95_length_19507_cov_71.031791_2_plen_172_part_00
MCISSKLGLGNHLRKPRCHLCQHLVTFGEARQLLASLEPARYRRVRRKVLDVAEVLLALAHFAKTACGMPCETRDGKREGSRASSNLPPRYLPHETEIEVRYVLISARVGLLPHRKGEAVSQASMVLSVAAGTGFGFNPRSGRIAGAKADKVISRVFLWCQLKYLPRQMHV